MLTRILIVLFAIGTFLLFTFNYYRNNVNPYKEDAIAKIIESEQIREDEAERLSAKLSEIQNQGLIIDYLSSQYFIGLIFLCLSIFLYFTCTHLFLEKLFFKKFYESPSYFDGFRRGVIVGLSVFLIQILRLNKVDFWTIAGVSLIIILLEVAFTSFVKKDLMKLINQRKD